jgi:hypothetical protein
MEICDPEISFPEILPYFLYHAVVAHMHHGYKSREAEITLPCYFRLGPPAMIGKKYLKILGKLPKIGNLHI